MILRFIFVACTVSSILSAAVSFNEAAVVREGTEERPSVVLNDDQAAVSSWTPGVGSRAYAAYDSENGDWATIVDPGFEVNGVSNVALNSSGDGMVVLYDNNGGELAFDTFSSGAWTGSAETISDTGTLLEDTPRLFLAMNESGNAIVAWQANSGVNAGHIYINYFNGTSWSNSVQISDSTAPANTIISTTLSSVNEGTVVWVDGFLFGVTLSGATPATAVTALSDEAAGPGYLSINADNNVLGIWYEANSNRTRFVFKEAGENFSVPATITSDQESLVETYDVQFTGVSDEAFAIYRNSSELPAVIKFDGASWSVSKVLSDSPAKPLGITSDGAGNLLAFFVLDTTGAVHFSEYDADSSSWSDAQAIEGAFSVAPDASFFYPYAASMNSSKSAMLVWIDPTTNDVMFSLGTDEQPVTIPDSGSQNGENSNENGSATPEEKLKDAVRYTPYKPSRGIPI